MTETLKEQAGDALRNLAAELLAPRYGEIKQEKRKSGKKLDLYFEDVRFGKKTQIFVEAKDYKNRITRKQIVEIWTDYSGLIKKYSPAMLLLVTRNGLTTDAQEFVDEEESDLRHQTIQEIENDALGIDQYVRSLEDEFYSDGLDQYYIDVGAHRVTYQNREQREVSESALPIFEELQRWLKAEGEGPVAILAGYGAGKSSLAKKLVSSQAHECLRDVAARRPILVRLGGLTRYSSITGLLGALYTHEFPVPSFNFNIFKKLNESGRLLIVLDGFDEMKHAMSWSDFQYQINDLAKLSSGNSKILLLGRPTAFLSFEEHLHILRGMKKFSGQYRKLPDWPEFSEFELSEFNREQIEEFIERYLRFRFSRKASMPEREKDARISEVQVLAANDYELFGKPVHLKILSDLASDSSVNLGRFSDGVTRWDLYDCLFSDLGQREAGKDARRGIEPKRRLSFLQELAFWLWTERGGSISFQISEMPNRLVVDLPEIADVDDAGLRELLTGAFLEKKDGDTFFFGHRSFAEFLVANRMIQNPPMGEMFGVYSHLVTDGVAQFLTDFPDRQIFEPWISALEDARGLINLEFFGFLQRQSGPLEEIWKRLPKESPVRFVAEAYIPDSSWFLEDPDNEPEAGLPYRLRQVLANPANSVFFPVLDLLLNIDAPRTGPSKEIGAAVVAKLLERVFVRAEVDVDARKTYVGEERDEARMLARRVLGDMEDKIAGRYIRLNWGRLLSEMRQHQEVSRLYFSFANAEADWSVREAEDIAWSDVLERIDEPANYNVTLHFRVSRTLDDVFTRAMSRKKRGR